MIDFRVTTRNFLHALLLCDDAELPEILAAHLHQDCIFDVAAPINRLVGILEISEKFVVPLRRALGHIHRRDELFIGGTNRRHEHGDWCASVTHYVGNFHAPLFGIRANDHLVLLRSGEFYHIDDGKIRLARIILDLPDLMRQTGRFPLPRVLGTETLWPGPATHDGIFPARRENSGRSLDIVEGMLGDLHEYDPETFQSKGQTGTHGYWAENMFWWGPGGIGSNFTYEGFDKDHRVSFLKAFPDRQGGNHYCRIGDGMYAAVSGWPSMTMTHKGTYLGVPATELSLTLRVMDFYRCTENQIAENWVLLDYIDLFAQMGVDLIARSEEMA